MFGWQAIPVDLETNRYEVKQCAVDIERGKLKLKLPGGDLAMSERQAMALQRAIGSALTFMRKLS